MKHQWKCPGYEVICMNWMLLLGCFPCKVNSTKSPSVKLHRPVAASCTQQSVVCTFIAQRAAQFRKPSEEPWVVINTAKGASESPNSWGEIHSKEKHPEVKDTDRLSDFVRLITPGH